MRKCPECENQSQDKITAVVLDVEEHGDYQYIDAGLFCHECEHKWQIIEVIEIDRREI